MRVGISLTTNYPEGTDPRQGARWIIERAAAARHAGLDSRQMLDLLWSNLADNLPSTPAHRFVQGTVTTEPLRVPVFPVVQPSNRTERSRSGPSRDVAVEQESGAHPAL